MAPFVPSHQVGTRSPDQFHEVAGEAGPEGHVEPRRACGAVRGAVEGILEILQATVEVPAEALRDRLHLGGVEHPASHADSHVRVGQPGSYQSITTHTR